MEKLVYRFSLDTHKNGIQRTLQGFETGDVIDRELEINLTSNGRVVEIPDNGVTAVLYVKKPSGTTVNMDAVVVEGNAFKCELSNSSLSEAGICESQLVVTDSTGRNLYSPKFEIEILQSLTNPGDSASVPNDTFSALQTAINNAQAAYDSRIVDISYSDDHILYITYGDGEQLVTDKIAQFLENVKVTAKGDKGERGDRGPAGEAGVYIGPYEPENREIRVWIDTSNASADNVVFESALDGTTIYKGNDNKIHASGGSGGSSIDDDETSNTKTWSSGKIYNELAGKISSDQLATVNGQSITDGGNIVISSGTSDYTSLSNKPSINGVTLSGAKSLSDLGIESAITAKGYQTASQVNALISSALSALDANEVIY